MRKIIPFLDNTGKINFPGDEGDENVGNYDDTVDSDNNMVDLEAQQTADRIELHQRQQVGELFNDLLNTLRLRAISPRIWYDELENHLSAYEYWRDV